VFADGARLQVSLDENACLPTPRFFGADCGNAGAILPGLARRHNVLHLEADVIEALAHASVQVFVAWSDQKTDFAVGKRYFLVSGKLFDAL
jgi:hypothetical protein